MKKTVKGIVAGILIGSIGTCGVAYAKSNMETITVQYDNIKVYKDNVLCDLKDSNGRKVEPFIYNGTTYLPLRGTAQLAGLDVTWDGKTKSVYLWDEMIPETKKTYLMEVCPPYETNYGYYSANGKVKDGSNVFSMAGKSYAHGFKVDFCSETMGSELLFNLNGKYRQLEFDLGAVDEHIGLPLMLKIYLDGSLTYTLEMEGTSLPEHKVIDLDNAKQMKIEAVSAKGNGMWGSQFGIANAILR